MLFGVFVAGAVSNTSFAVKLLDVISPSIDSPLIFFLHEEINKQTERTRVI
jgi:hypothetical protein